MEARIVRLRHSLERRGLIAAAVIACAQPAYAQLVEEPAPQVKAPEDPVALEGVTVTAQKREQLLQYVPVSVTVISSKELEGARIDSGTEIARLTPNLRVSVLGDESQPKFALRGISTPEFNLNAISPTGVFFDEVYVGASYLGGAQIFDVERVEVLRGPQGTLFGKNTTAGAVNFISRRPSFSDEGEITVGYGSYDYMETKGAIEKPLIANHLTARIAFAAAHSDGYVDNLNPAGHDLSNIDRKAGRLTLAFKDGSGFDSTLRLFTAHNNPYAIGAINQGTGPGGVNALGLNPRVNPFDGSPLARDEVVTDRSGTIEVRGSGGYLTLNKDLGFGTLTFINSYIAGRFSNLADADGTIAPLLHIDFASKTREISQDLRLASAFDGPFQLIAGLYTQSDDLRVGTDYALFGGTPFSATLAQSYRQQRHSYAAYLDGTYDLSKMLSLYGGVRFTRDQGRMTNFQVVPAIPRQSEKSYNNGEPTGRVGLSVKLTRDLLIYSQFARGYRSSAINGGALTNPADLTVAQPEKLDAYELGVKSQFGRLLTLNASAFFYNFKDQQFLNVVGIGNQQLVNAGRSRIKGGELEAVLRPAKGFRLNAGLGLLDSSYRELDLNGADLAGNELIETPHYTANLSGDYSVPINAYSLSVHADATFIGKQFFLATNSPESQIGSSRNVGARVALRSPSGRYEIALYGKNLTDNKVAAGLAIDPTTQTRFTPVPYPQRFGVELSAQY